MPCGWRTTLDATRHRNAVRVLRRSAPRPGGRPLLRPFGKPLARTLAPLLIVLTAGVAAGCGSSPSAAPKGAQPPSASAPPGSAKSTTAGPASSAAKPPSPSGKLKHVSFILEWLPVGYDAPFVYGLTSGIFKKYGLDVTWHWGKGSGTATKDAAAGRVDFGEGAATAVLKLRAGGLPVKMVMGYMQQQPASIIFRAGEHLKSPSDLKGKSLGLTPGGGTTLLLPAFLAKVHLTKSELKIEDMSGSEKPLALLDGKVDSILSLGIEYQPALAAKGLQTGVFNYADYGVNPLYLGIVTSDKLIQSEPGVVRDFVQAAVESVKQAKLHPKAAVQAVLSAAPATSPPRKVLSEQLQAGWKFMTTANDAGHPVGWQSPKDWSMTQALAERYLGLKTNVPLTDDFTNRFVTGK